MVGDFNFSKSSTEKDFVGGATRSMELFNAFIEEGNLVDRKLNGKLTLACSRVHSRIDRFLLSKEWLNCVGEVDKC